MSSVDGVKPCRLHATRRTWITDKGSPPQALGRRAPPGRTARRRRSLPLRPPPPSGARAAKQRAGGQPRGCPRPPPEPVNSSTRTTWGAAARRETTQHATVVQRGQRRAPAGPDAQGAAASLYGVEVGCGDLVGRSTTDGCQPCTVSAAAPAGLRPSVGLARIRDSGRTSRSRQRTRDALLVA
jgi:hypothetical protein